MLYPLPDKISDLGSLIRYRDKLWPEKARTAVQEFHLRFMWIVPQIKSAVDLLDKFMEVHDYFEFEYISVFRLRRGGE